MTGQAIDERRIRDALWPHADEIMRIAREGHPVVVVERPSPRVRGGLAVFPLEGRTTSIDPAWYEHSGVRVVLVAENESLFVALDVDDGDLRGALGRMTTASPNDLPTDGQTRIAALRIVR